MRKMFFKNNNTAHHQQHQQLLLDDIQLLRQLSDSILTVDSSSSPAISIPSLSGDSSFIFSAASVVASLRKEVLAWASPIEEEESGSQGDKKNNLSLRNSRNVFWSIVSAHTTGYESRHHNGECSVCSWLIPAVATKLLQKFIVFLPSSSDRRRFVARLRDIQARFQNFLQHTNNNSVAPTARFNFENVTPLSRRWVDVALSAVQSSRALSSLTTDHQRRHLATVIVQALLAVCVPGRGIFVDRVKAVAVHEQNVKARHTNDAMTGISCDSGSSSSDYDEEGLPADSVSEPLAELRRGFRLPPFSLESRVIWNRLRQKKRRNAAAAGADDEMPVLALLVSCSILTEMDSAAILAMIKSGASQTDSPNLPVVLICQRLVPPAVKIQLASDAAAAAPAGILTVDRLGIQHFPLVQQLLNVLSPVHELRTQNAPQQLLVPCFLSQEDFPSGVGLWLSPAAAPSSTAAAVLAPPIHTIVLPSQSALSFVAAGTAMERAVLSCVKSTGQLMADGLCVLSRPLRCGRSWFVMSRWRHF